MYLSLERDEKTMFTVILPVPRYIPKYNRLYTKFGSGGNLRHRRVDAACKMMYLEMALKSQQQFNHR